MNLNYLQRTLNAIVDDRRVKTIQYAYDFHDLNIRNELEITHVKLNINNKIVYAKQLKLSKKLEFFCFTQAEFNDLISHGLSEYKEKMMWKQKDKSKDNFRIDDDTLLSLIVDLFHDKIFGFITLTQREEWELSKINMFGFGALFYLYITGKITNNFILKNQECMQYIYNYNEFNSEPDDFFSVFGDLLQCYCIDIGDGIRCLSLPTKKSTYNLFARHDYGNLIYNNNYRIFWPVKLNNVTEHIFPINSTYMLGIHLYDTFNYLHYHVFDSVLQVLEYAVFNVWRSWRAQIFCQQKQLQFERRLNYVALCNDTCYNAMPATGRRYYHILKILCGTPTVASTISSFSTDKGLFVEQIRKYLADELRGLGRQWGLNLGTLSDLYIRQHRMVSYIGNEQARVFNESPTPYIQIANLREIIRNGIRYPAIDFNVTNEETSYQVDSNKRVVHIGYPLGPQRDIGRLLVTLRLLEYENYITFNSVHQMWMVFGHMEGNPRCYVEPLATGIIDANLVNNVYANRRYRGLGTDQFKNKLEPTKFLKTIPKSSIRIDDDSLASKIVMAYTSNKPILNIGSFSDSLDSDFNKDWNGSTLKLCSLMIYCYATDIYQNADNLANLTQERVYYRMLGVVNEPSIGVIDRLTHGRWSGSGFGRNAEYPRQAADIEQVVESNQYNITVSDIDQTTIQGATVAVKNVAIADAVMGIVRRYYNITGSFLLIKVNYLISSIFNALTTYFTDVGILEKPIIKFVKNQFSPFGSSECYLYIRKTLKAGEVPLYTWTDFEISNIILSLGCYNTIYNNLPFRLQTDIPHVVNFDVNEYDELGFYNAGNLIALKETVDYFTDSLSLFSHLCEEVTSGYVKPNFFKMFSMSGIISLKRCLLSARLFSPKRVLVGGVLRDLSGIYDVSAELDTQILYRHASLFKAFTNGQRFGIWTRYIVAELDSTIPVIDIGGRDFEGIIFTYCGQDVDERLILRNYTLYDPNVMLADFDEYNITIHNEFITNDVFLTYLSGNIVIAYNSFYMLEGETHAALLARLRSLIGVPDITYLVISFYCYDEAYLTNFNHISEIITIPTDDDDSMTFRNFGGCGYITQDEKVTLHNDLINGGAAVTEIYTTATEVMLGNCLYGVSCDGHAINTLPVLNTSQVAWIIQS
ncbi:Inner core protein [Hubei insect virus 2]|uniref:Inner core protein n=1 Tax=Hubei insect virus 2 TaxID=1922898 RepID=UPI00090AEF71|nr:Inner core protein [Hubei insect virus 2]APG79059.1 Inner core protein [Hubei insect virus 2]